MSNAAPAWYNDPTDLALLRYWDGRQWTEHTAPRERPQPVQSPPPPQVAPTPIPVPAIQQPVIAPQPASTRKVTLFGARSAAKDLAAENDQLRSALSRAGALTLAEIEQETTSAREQLAHLLGQIRQSETQASAESAAARVELEALQAQILDVRHALDVQEFGLYDFEHPAESSATLAGQVADVRAQIKSTVSSGGAVHASTTFTFNGSAAKGKQMVKGLTKTMLAAYNAEAENAIKTVKAGGLSTANARLDRVVDQVARNGEMIDLSITATYHRLRKRELALAAKYAEAIKAEREAEKERRAELREAKQAEDELRREREKLDKEREHYANALAALQARGDEIGAAELMAKLAQIDRSIADVDYRAANIRAGYVYVISNLGSFGGTVVKIGMTRRLDPMDRVRELSDASVPFNFDVHALFFSADAFGIEAMLHRHFADQRVNRINTRREFFYTTPADVLEVLREHKVSIVEYRTDADAEEFLASRAIASAGLTATANTGV